MNLKWVDRFSPNSRVKASQKGELIDIDLKYWFPLNKRTKCFTF